MRRFSRGLGGSARWQADLPARAPRWLVPDRPGRDGLNRLVIDEPAALVWVAGQTGLEWRVDLHRPQHSHNPSFAVIDIAAPTLEDWPDVLAVARLYRTAMGHLGLTTQPVLDGVSGLSIWVPFAEGPTTTQVKAWTRRLAKTVTAVAPELAELIGREPAEHLAPYSPRAVPGLPVCAPIDWADLDDPRLRPDRWTVRTVAAQLADGGDLLAIVSAAEQRLPDLNQA